jgi:UDP-glucose 4-epimerase
MAASNPILVSGGRSRLASLIADHFRTPAHALSLFSRTPGAGFGALSDLERSATYARAGTVLHLAWSTLPASSELHPRIEWDQDLPLLARMLEAMTASPARDKIHFLFFSSGGAVYGNAPGRPNVETDPCHPVGCYGRAKRAAEEMIEAHVARHGLAATILRISNPYGYPVPKSRVQGIIPHALRCAAEGLPLDLWGDGTARKDFLYYTDFLSGLEEVISRRLTGTVNLCAGVSHSVREVIALVEKNTTRPVALRFQPGPAWDVHDSRLDHQRLAAASGWRPQVMLDEGIRRAAAGYADL